MTLKINNKLVAYEGCIGRREYLLNLIYLSMINSFLVAPFSYWMLTKAPNPADIFNFSKILTTAPIFVTFFWTVACVIGAVLGFGLFIRRLSDITGAQAGVRGYILATALIVIPYLWFFYMNPLTALLLIISFVVSCVMICVPGKITGQLPADSVKRFNWGAFWGTWIWGLFNKTYVTLWAIPLFFTPAFFSWCLICGIKGNEWAFKNRNALDTEAFHKEQKVQAVVWNCLAGFFLFVMPILLVFLISALAVTSAIKNPGGIEKVLNTAESAVELFIEDSFDNYELDIDENRFYVDPQQWSELTFDGRYNLFKGAATLASIKKQRSEDDKFEGYRGSKTTEMTITKIYSTYNGELLAEFNMDESEVTDFKSAFKAALKAIYFNTNPELPPALPNE